MRNRPQRDPTDLLGQAHDNEQETLAVREAELQRIADMKWLMNDKRGRRIMWRLLETTGVYRSSFTGNSETFFREGARNVGLGLMAEITEHTLNEYAEMLKEGKQQ